MTGMIGRKTKVAIGACVLALAVSLGSSRVGALGTEPKPGENITQYLTPTILHAIFPGADKLVKSPAHRRPSRFTGMGG